MLLAWTTVAQRADADRLADQAVDRQLAACVQIDGPITSHYRWQDRVERAQEFRLCFKLLPEQLPALEAFVLSHHPYKTPEWIVVAATRVSEKYLSWAQASSTNPSL